MGVIWTTRSGYKLHSRDMSTSHILNCINMLNRKYEQELCMTLKQRYYNRDLVSAFRAELNSREAKKRSVNKMFRRMVRNEIRNIDRDYI